MKKLVGGKNGTRVARGSTPTAWVLVLGALLVTASAMADDLTITSAGVQNLEKNSNYEQLINTATDGEVTLKSSGNAVEADKISFTYFDAPASGVKTTFDGGYWDFGVTDQTAFDYTFMTNTLTYANRAITLTNGAVVTGIAAASLAGTGACNNNTLSLFGASSMYLNYLYLSNSSANDTKCKVTVTDGSLLHCYQDLELTWYSANYSEKKLSRNSLEVTGEGTRLEVDGDLGVSGSMVKKPHSTYDSYHGSIGGNTFTLKDKATADVGTLQICAGLYHGCSNLVTVAGAGTRLTTGGISIMNSWCSDDKAIAGNRFEILDGAVVTNTGYFSYGGGNYSYNRDNTVIVSNATLHLAKPSGSDGSSHFLNGKDDKFIISGPDAKFSFGTGPSFFFSANQRGCEFIVENYANYRFPNSTYAYTTQCYDATVIARDHATITFSGSIQTCNNGNADRDATCRNRLVAENDSTLAIGSHCYIHGSFSELVVDSATVTSPHSIHIGAIVEGTKRASTNCTLRIKGSRPYVRAGWNIMVYTNNFVCIELPAEGYDEGYATHAKPLIYAGEGSGEMGVDFQSSSQLQLEGVEDLIEHHRAIGKKGSYYLMRANNIYMRGDAAQMFADLQASLPDEAELVLHPSDGNGINSYLRLDIKPKFGLILLVK